MSSLGITDAYKLYRREVKNPKNERIFKLVTEEFNKFLFRKLIEGEEVSLFERLGRLVIAGRKTKPRIDPNTGYVKGLAPDWKETKKLWESNPKAKEQKELVYYFNEHTNGVRYRLHWTKQKVYIRNKDFYMFRLTRDNKQEVHNAINKGREYITL